MLQDKVALVTGGARGMGAAEARLLAAHGARVTIADVLDEEGRATAEEISGDTGSAVRFVHLDVTSAEQWSTAVEQAIDDHGRIDALVNNAGITGSRIPEDAFDLASWNALIDVNLHGVFLGCRAVVPQMVRAGGGAVVNIASVAALRGVTGAAFGYQASKAAVRVLTKALAGAYAAQGVRVNAVLPGFMPPMHGGAPRPELAEAVPMGRIGEVSDIASAVLYLLSPAAAYVTGTDLVVDGGLSSQLPMPR